MIGDEEMMPPCCTKVSAKKYAKQIKHLALCNCPLVICNIFQMQKFL
jgi:hypothetical protein